MDKLWKENVLRLAYSASEQDEREYVALVYQAEGKVTSEIAQVLLRTFRDEPDYGAQESVVAVLATADQETYIHALLEELPRLLNDAPEWAASLTEYAINFSSEELIKVAQQMDQSVRNTLIEAITRFSLQHDTHNGQAVLTALTKSVGSS
jgi:hypothetical protein